MRRYFGLLLCAVSISANAEEAGSFAYGPNPSTIRAVRLVAQPSAVLPLGSTSSAAERNDEARWGTKGHGGMGSVLVMLSRLRRGEIDGGQVKVTLRSGFAAMETEHFKIALRSGSASMVSMMWSKAF